MTESDDIYKHPKWLSRREEILRRDGYRCILCGSLDMLSVHHLYYVKDCAIWDYPTIALVTLCKDCHRDFHETYKNRYRANHLTNKTGDEKGEILERSEWMAQLKKAAQEARNTEELYQQKGKDVLEIIKEIDWGVIKYKETTTGIHHIQENAVVLTFWVHSCNKHRKQGRKILYFPFSETYYDMKTKVMGKCSPHELKEMLQQHSPGKLTT